MNMGYCEDYAKSAIRLSFSQYLTQSDVEAIWDRFEKVISRFLVNDLKE